jgi:TonB family protein
MRVRQYLIASLILHAVLITAAFSVLYRERACPLPIHFMEVSVVEDFGLAKFFSNPPNDNVKNHSEVKKESQERRVQRASKSFSSSPGWTDYNQVSSADDREGERELRDFEVGISLTNSQSEVEEQDIRVGSSMDSQHFKTERYYSSVVGEMSAHQGIVLTSVNTSPQDFRGNDFYRAIRTLLEKARSYPLLARKRGLEGTVFVSFVIGSRGLPQDVKIMKSSGHQILDEEVKKMLKKASPFPGIKGEIVIPITFKLTESISNR